MLAAWWIFYLAVHALLFALIFSPKMLIPQSQQLCLIQHCYSQCPAQWKNHVEKPQCLWRELKSDTMQKYELDTWFTDEFSRDQKIVTIGVQAKKRSDVWRRYSNRRVKCSPLKLHYTLGLDYSSASNKHIILWVWTTILPATNTFCEPAFLPVKWKQ